MGSEVINKWFTGYRKDIDCFSLSFPQRGFFVKRRKLQRFTRFKRSYQQESGGHTPNCSFQILIEVIPRRRYRSAGRGRARPSMLITAAEADKRKGAKPPAVSWLPSINYLIILTLFILSRL